MDPLSISVGVIALIQATNGVILFATTVKGANQAICSLHDEMKGLRNILESLERLLSSSEDADRAPTIQLKQVAVLCDFPNGLIAREMKLLHDKLHLPDWASHDGSRRKSLLQSLTWPLKEGDTKKILEKMVRLKIDLELALTVDQSYVSPTFSKLAI